MTSLQTTIASSTASETVASKTTDAVNDAVKVKVLVLRGGGGHFTTYQALNTALAQQQPHWQLEPVFVDTLGEDSQHRAAGQVSQAVGIGSDKFYDLILKNGFGWIHLITLHLHKLITRLKHSLDVRLLAEIWRADPPDLVLSVVPFHNRALAESVQSAQLDAPVVSILTDFADSPPAYWAEPSTRNFLVCPTEKAMAQALARGIAPERVIKTSGLIIHPKFYEPQARDIAAEREKLGLDPDRITGLVLFGANGSNAMIEIAKRLAPLANRLQLIFLCGRNQAVADALREMSREMSREMPREIPNAIGSDRPVSIQQAVIGFTPEIAHYMHLADFFIGKPGNVSVSEAIAMNLPPIVERNWLTLPQERYAADWIKEKEVGLTVSSFRKIYPAVEAMIEPENFARYQANVARFENRAVFDIPQLLQGILAQKNERKRMGEK